MESLTKGIYLDIPLEKTEKLRKKLLLVYVGSVSKRLAL